MIQLIQISEDRLLDKISEVVNDNLNKHIKVLKPPIQDHWLTRKETAKYLSVSYVTLNSWSKAGILTVYKIGNRVRYKQSEVELAIIKVKY